ncbi:MAG: cell division protein FtsL [Buchnera aphidicola (Floraphis choui)]
MKNDTYTLSKIILNDLMTIHKKVLILLLMITISAISIVTIIHKTRLLISQEEQLNTVEKRIKTEWNNLILEKILLTSHSRIEKYAIEKLNMTFLDPSQENIILQ